tara:strand:+ start:374 stop:925 length:552 start_codon:yes stop_codon:yes gene_type:complete
VKIAQHAVAGVGIISAALAAGTVWWVMILETGIQIEVVGSQANPTLWSVALVVLATYGLQFVLVRLMRKLGAILQVLTSTFAGWLAWISPTDMDASSTDQIARLTGLAGENALSLIESSVVTGWHFSLVFASFLFALSGIFGALRPDAPGHSNRFVANSNEGQMEDSVTIWDALSDGIDPTHR